MHQASPGWFGFLGRHWNVQGLSRASLLAGIGLCILLWCPLSTRIEFGGDEGYELQKAALLQRGFTLYTDLWNDQPPLHTWLLRVVFDVLGAHAFWARLISVGAALFVGWSVGLWGCRLAGQCGGALCVLPLFGSSLYFMLGTSAMLEMPTIAAAFVAVNAAGSPRLSPRTAAVMAGALMGLAAQVKVTALLYAPACVCLLWLRADENAVRRWWAGPALKLTAFLAAFGLSFFAIALAWPGELNAILTHFSGRMKSAFEGEHTFHFRQLLTQPAIFMIVALLPAAGIVRRWRSALPFVVTLASTLTVLHLHAPYWNYYLLHLLVPAAVLSALPIQVGWESFRGLFFPKLSPPLKVGQTICLIPLIYCLIEGPAQFVRQLRASRASDSVLASELQSWFSSTTPHSEWAFSIRPVFAFHARLPTPPKTTIIPQKRVRLDEHLSDSICRDLERYRPGLVYLLSFMLDARLQEVLDQDYRPVFRDGDHCLFLRRDIPVNSERRTAASQLSLTPP